MKKRAIVNGFVNGLLKFIKVPGSQIFVQIAKFQAKFSSKMLVGTKKLKVAENQEITKKEQVSVTSKH